MGCGVGRVGNTQLATSALPHTPCSNVGPEATRGQETYSHHPVCPGRTQPRTTVNTEGSDFEATSIWDSTFADLSAHVISPQHKGICFMGNKKFYLSKLDHISQSAQHFSGIRVLARCPCPCPDLCISHLDAQILKV